MASAALFKILYENEVLFRGQNPVPAIPAEITAPAEPVKETNPAPEQPRPQSATPATPPITPIIPTPPPAAQPVQEAFPAIRFPIVILADEPTQKDLIEAEALFLDNILKAVKHSLATSTVLNLSYLPGRDARKALAEKRASYFVTFGVPLIKINLDLLLAPYEPKMIDGVWFLLADPLVVVEADRNLKKKLWQALQKMFEVS